MQIQTTGSYHVLLRSRGLPVRYNEMRPEDIAEVQVIEFPHGSSTERTRFGGDDRNEWACEVVAALLLYPIWHFIADLRNGLSVAEMAERAGVEEWVIRFRAAILGEEGI